MKLCKHKEWPMSCWACYLQDLQIRERKGKLEGLEPELLEDYRKDPTPYETTL